jgi:hypothetical protein
MIFAKQRKEISAHRKLRLPWSPQQQPIQFATKYLEDRAILAARAEMEQLILSTQQTQTTETPVQPSPNSPLLSSGSQGYTNLDVQ